MSYTYTDTVISKFVVNSNTHGLGEVFYVTDDYIPDNLYKDEDSIPENKSGYVAYEHRYWFFKPNPGVRFTIKKQETKKDAYGEVVTYDPTWHNSGGAYYRNLSQHSQDGWFDFEWAGCVYLTDGYITTQKSKYKYDGEESENSPHDSTSENTTTWEFDISGESNYLNIKVFGENSQPQRFLYYVHVYMNQDNSEGTEHGCIFRKTSNEQTYTHIVGFDEQYNENSTNLPDKVLQIRIPNGYGDAVGYWQRKQELMEPVNEYGYTYENSPYELYGSTLCSNGILVKWQYDKNASNGKSEDYNYIDLYPIRTILMYINSSFIICPTINWDSEEQTINCITTSVCDSGRYNASTQFEKFGDGDGVLGGISVPNDIRITDSASQTELIPYTSLFYKVGESNILLDQWRDNIDFIGKTIPKEHRWLALTRISPNYWSNYYGSRCIGASEIVKYVDWSTGAKNITENIKVQSVCSRFTGYWGVFIYGTDCVKVIKQDDQIDISNIGIRDYYIRPIMKPWAAVHLHIFPEDKDNTDLGGSRQYSPYYQFVTKHLKDNFGIEYFTEFTINANDPWDKVHEQLRKYAQIQAPVRVETFNVYGDRVEYDIDNRQELNGHSVLRVSSDKCIGHDELYSFHKLCQECNWNNSGELFRYIFVPSDYGQGSIGYQINRGQWSPSEDQIGIETTSSAHFDEDNDKKVLYVKVNASPLLTYDGSNDSDKEAFKVDNRNYSYELQYVPYCIGLFTSSSNHNSINVDGEPADISILSDIISENDTNASVVNKFNDKISSYKSKVFKLIKDFYFSNYNLMLSLLKDEYIDQFKYETPYIVRDLNHNGRHYFCMQNVGKDKQNYQASDNYFDPSTKNYPINGGFIGFIKYYISQYLGVSKTNINAQSNLPETTYLPMGIFKDDGQGIKSYVDELSSSISKLFKSQVQSSLAITEPVMINKSGTIYKATDYSSTVNTNDGKFLKYPDEDVNIYCASDDDLQFLKELSMTTSLENLRFNN